MIAYIEQNKGGTWADKLPPGDAVGDLSTAQLVNWFESYYHGGVEQFIEVLYDCE